MTVGLAGLTLSAGSRAGLAGLTIASASGGSRAGVAGFTIAASHPSAGLAGLTITSVSAPVTPIVDPIPARTVLGWDTVTVTPHATPTPDTWIFTVLAGGVDLAGSGNSRTFTAPALFAGTTVRIGVQASKSGVVSQQQVGVYTVTPWNSFVLATTTTPAAVTNVIDGGTGTGTVPDAIDGGTSSTSPADTVDGGGSGTGTAWIPRRPIQLI